MVVMGMQPLGYESFNRQLFTDHMLVSTTQKTREKSSLLSWSSYVWAGVRVGTDRLTLNAMLGTATVYSDQSELGVAL